jgi:hypothetical protein
MNAAVPASPCAGGADAVVACGVFIFAAPVARRGG